MVLSGPSAYEETDRLDGGLWTGKGLVRLSNGIVVQYSFHHAGRAKSRLNSPLREQSKTSKGPPLDCTLCHYIV